MSSKYIRNGKVYGFSVEGGRKLTDDEFKTFKLKQELDALKLIAPDDLTEEITDRISELESTI